MVRFILQRLGLICVRKKSVRDFFKEYSYEDAIWDPKLQPIFYVNKTDLIDVFAHPFKAKKNAYYDSINEYDQRLHLEYSGSSLETFYQKFQPQSTKEVFFCAKENNQTLPSKGLFEILLPWMKEPIRKTDGTKLNYCGPMSNKRGLFEYRRLILVYNSIKDQGYKPKESTNLFNSNHIQGYFLNIGNNYRFVVLHGKHRAASLVYLGMLKIPVTFNLTIPRVIRITDIMNWPQVRNNTYSESEARQIFMSFFDLG